MKSRFLTKDRIITVCVFAVFVFTMVFNLTHSALWGDEWNEYTISQMPIKTGEMYSHIIRTFQPPLYNWVMHFWLRLGTDVFWFRFFNVVIGTISGIILFLSVKSLCGIRAAQITCLALAFVFRWVYCMQECSEYALMLFFVFLAMAFFLRALRTNRMSDIIFFTLSCIGGIYSQYGGAIVLVPMLVIYYIRFVFASGESRKKKLIVSGWYLLCLIAFALPLYLLFARIQMEANQISENTVHFSVGMLQDVLFIPGRMLGYFLHIRRKGIWLILENIVSVILLASSLYVFLKKDESRFGKYCMAVFWCTYLLHYFLVKLQIYAMGKPGESAGFYTRYSYFWIPLLCFVVPVTAASVWRGASSMWQRGIVLLLAAAGCAALVWSGQAMLKNWHKAMDDIYARIWMENEGWKARTYLFGKAEYGFRYYVSHEEGYQDGYLSLAVKGVNMDNLPPQFWAWRTNWGGEGWKTLVETARERGYTVTVYDNSGYKGQLAYCDLEG